MFQVTCFIFREDVGDPALHITADIVTINLYTALSNHYKFTRRCYRMYMPLTVNCTANVIYNTLMWRRETGLFPMTNPHICREISH